MLMLTPIVLAIVSMSSAREVLQDMFAAGSVYFADHAVAMTTCTLVAAVVCVLGCRQSCRRQPLGPITTTPRGAAPAVASKPADGGQSTQWQYFSYANVVASVVFPVALAWLMMTLSTSTVSFTPAALLTRHGDFLCAAFLSTVSFSYLLLFAGVGAVRPVAVASTTAALGVAAAPRTSKLSIRDDPDVVVVGAGTTGASLAAALGDRGYRVLLLEKTMVQPDRIVGELLQPGGLRVLERLGLDACAKDGLDSVPVRGYTVFKTDGTELPLLYPSSDPSTALNHVGVGQFNPYSPAKAKTLASPNVDPADPRPTGRSFHNTRFVDNLRAACAAHPNVVLQEGTAKQLVTEPCKHPAARGKERIRGVTWTDAEGVSHTARAPLTVMADGIWSNFRRKMTTAKAEKVSHFVGYILHHPKNESPLPRRYFGHVVLTDPTPVLLYQISSTETRILVDTGNKLPSVTSGAMTKFMLEVTLPQLPPAIRPYFREAVTTQRPQSMPNRALEARPDPLHVGGLLLGDAFNMRHPLTGGGMTVCLKDVEMFVHALARHVPDRRLDDLHGLGAAIAAFQRDRAAHASTVNVLAYALYRVFSKPEQDDGTRQQFRDACYEYLAMGGTRTAGPIGLLSALTPYPWVLASHFFFVAAHAMRRALFPFPTPSRLRLAYNILHVACIIIMPQLEAEGVTVLATWPLRALTNVLFPWRGVVLEQ